MLIRFQMEKPNIQSVTTCQAFDDQDCAKIISSAEKTPIIISDANQVYKKYMVDISDENMWLYEKISYLFAKVNLDVFSYSITGITEPLELLEIPINGFIGWHNELSKNNIRKLAVYACLTTNYSGGMYQEFSGNVKEHPYLLGQAIISNPYVFTQIGKVDDGTLYLLRGWATGQGFR